MIQDELKSAGLPTEQSMIEKSEIQPGDFFEDCGFRPALCLGIEKDENGNDDLVRGICILNGDLVACALHGCAPRLLSKEETIKLIMNGPESERLAALACLPLETWESKDRWWESEKIAFLKKCLE